ncbi:MAG TPA: deoxyribodipyrimidine photo-lyase, partial [Rhodocyclaceae bacterium]|nr:deoxyribodipyrimidine photo-lyase [Rhodocyclaceae bacterium]
MTAAIISGTQSLERALVWFRRDLRDVDHTALSAALLAAREVYCAFIFDRNILAGLPQQDRRVEFIHASLQELDAALRARGGGLIVRDGLPEEEIPALAKTLGAQGVFANRDYEPQAKTRDGVVADVLRKEGIAYLALKDQAIFDGEEVLTGAGTPYTVFTPYSRSWLKRLMLEGVPCHACEGVLAATPLAQGVPSLQALGFAATNL